MRYFQRLSFFFLFSLLFLCSLVGQQDVEIYGYIDDVETKAPIDFVTVYIENSPCVAETNENGEYLLRCPSRESMTIAFSRIGYKSTQVELGSLPEGSRKRLNISLASAESSLEVIVTESRTEVDGMIETSMENLRQIPTTSGNLESVLPSIALGATSGTGGELTSQYNVRGGNYDENLVYVNGFEIYRPQLITNAQQEGLSFPNPDLMRNLSFSSGGFEARYGDKMSSVLDIQYKIPDSLAGSVSASFLGATAHVEGSKSLNKEKNKKIRYLAGARYKTTQYILSSTDITGEYVPQFVDLQSYLTVDLSKTLKLGWLTNFNNSVYRLTPQERNTAFGLIGQSLQLSSSFDGNERIDYRTIMNGVSLTYLPEKKTDPWFVKFRASTFQGDEREAIDVRGFYRLAQIESSIGAENQGEEIQVLGEGTQHNFIRTQLSTNVSNVELQGGKEFNRSVVGGGYRNHFIQWGVKAQNEIIEDRVNEWERLDSAGYSLPFSTDEVLIQETVKGRNSLESQRYTGFIQNSFSVLNPAQSEWRVTLGGRFQYWTLNKETIVSPRAQVLYKPLGLSDDISFRLAGGLYAQPAFYRELRGLDATINPDLESQKSAHVVGGLTYDFKFGKRNPKKFRLILEAYYKRLWDIVSYEVDNVRIRYSGVNDAEGFVRGIDFRINGEFVPGSESWINFSFLQARENLLDVQHKQRDRGTPEGEDVTFVPRPTDRTFNMNIFFQDYLKDNDRFRVHMNLSLGKGLPFGLRGDNEIYRNTYRFSVYRRVDIGFSLNLWDERMEARGARSPFSFTRNAWVSLEVFNLLGIQNVAANTWITAIDGTQYAVPNELTSRRLNLRFRLDF